MASCWATAAGRRQGASPRMSRVTHGLQRLFTVVRADNGVMLVRPALLFTWHVPTPRSPPLSCALTLRPAGAAAWWPAFWPSTSPPTARNKRSASRRKRSSRLRRRRVLPRAALRARVPALTRALQAFSSALYSTLYPALALSSHISHAPGGAMHSNAKAYFEAAAPELLSVSPAIDDIQLAPYGRAVQIIPLLTDRRNATAIIALGGHDLFNASSPVANRRGAALLALKSRQLIMEGPKYLLIPGLLGPIPGLWCVIHLC